MDFISWRIISTGWSELPNSPTITSGPLLDTVLKYLITMIQWIIVSSSTWGRFCWSLLGDSAGWSYAISSDSVVDHVSGELAHLLEFLKLFFSALMLFRGPRPFQNPESSGLVHLRDQKILRWWPSGTRYIWDIASAEPVNYARMTLRNLEYLE